MNKSKENTQEGERNMNKTQYESTTANDNPYLADDICKVRTDSNANHEKTHAKLDEILEHVDSKDVQDGSSVTDANEQGYQELWEEAIRFSSKGFVYVLMTDDSYSDDDICRLEAIKWLNWSLMIDVGTDPGTRVLNNTLLKYYASTKEVVSFSNANSLVTFRNTLNVLSARKDEGASSYMSLWGKSQEAIIGALKKLVDESRQTPLVLVLDFCSETATFRNKFISSMVGSIKLPSGSRIVLLRSEVPDSLSDEVQYLEEDCKLSFATFPKATLIQIAKTCQKYFERPQKTKHEAEIPSLDGVVTFSERELVSFGTSIELVYPGCEMDDEHSLSLPDGKGGIRGEKFYRGNESSWKDISENIDLPLLDEREYNRKLSEFKKFIEASTRVTHARIVHGAGTGGTTLSKRVLWDLKTVYPCARLLKYNSNTAAVLAEIFQRTGKSILLTVEDGSSVIGEEDLNKLAKDVDSSNSKLVVLRVQRDKEEKARKNAATVDRIYTAFKLLDTMNAVVANDFCDKFTEMTTDSDRKRLLKEITVVTNRMEQRSPFFYGFYTFQEEYKLGNIYRTIAECSENEKKLLSDLALITIFSQNICISDAEICERLSIDKIEHGYDHWGVVGNLSPTISKLTSVHKDGYRICHPIIAKGILTRLYGNNDEISGSDMEFNDFVYAAAQSYILNVSGIYGDSNAFVDDNLKELIIDRAFIDAEERKTKFSGLIEAISRWSEKKDLFDLLIEKFPRNPHYYSHLARLLAVGSRDGNITPSFGKAVEFAKEAISMADENGFEISTHYTNLGCIYSQWILHDLRSESKNARSGRFASDYPTLIDMISNRCLLAEDYFKKARELNKNDDRFNYYPQINMEARIISLLIQCDKHQRNDCKRLLQEEEAFGQWYDEHFSIATELLISMKKFTSKDDAFLTDAAHKVELANANYDESYVNRRLEEILKSQTSPILRRHSRSVVYSAFVQNGSKWDAMSADVLSLFEKCFRNNMTTNEPQHRQSDVKTWFEIYRRLFQFDEEEAQRNISDYMDDGYEKEYLLFLLTFLLYEKRQATRQDVEHHINEAYRLARLNGLNTVRQHDIYVCDESIIGCPIVSNNERYAELKRKKYTGIVQEVSQTHGKLLMDGLNLEVMFVPNPSFKQSNKADEDFERRTFTREDIGCKVQFNLMFSYSGLRAFNSVKELR
jgi:hypothetical protein